ncbi:hypothetical protein GGTG_10634 [Gaeumannomyces tritici R3-111a-1]|uniref:Uncharacterized protein n=1 Tax=Gaeumannomyces tritici (strain R3-111a-1) TaxID=644352 RepID=J3PAV9_GAET3|nr:hypothetical protein GGTG_10634 [Gaeumannomyces tritici R3-111a-1]EJT71375.1 hypothetical protein GGTG_10634 [Gaeumannomyces tritici R3-111a-1]
MSLYPSRRIRPSRYHFVIHDLVSGTIEDLSTPGATLEVQGRVAKTESAADAGYISVTVEKFTKAESITNAGQVPEMQAWPREANPVWIKKEDLRYHRESRWQE